MKNGLMNRPLIVGIVGIVIVAALLIGVTAYGQRGQFLSGVAEGTETGARGTGTCVYHDDMQVVMESGTYADLVALREESGKPMMPWVQDDASFAQAQTLYEQNGGTGFGSRGAGCGMHAGAAGAQGNLDGRGAVHRCPMMDGDE